MVGGRNPKFETVAFVPCLFAFKTGEGVVEKRDITGSPLWDCNISSTFVETFMVSRGWILTFTPDWCFPLCHHKVEIICRNIPTCIGLTAIKLKREILASQRMKLALFILLLFDKIIYYTYFWGFPDFFSSSSPTINWITTKFVTDIQIYFLCPMPEGRIFLKSCEIFQHIPHGSANYFVQTFMFSRTEPLVWLCRPSVLLNV